MATPKSKEAQRVLRTLDAELAAAAKVAERELGWSAAEREVLNLVAAQIDRKVELAQRYTEAGVPMAQYLAGGRNGHQVKIR